MREIKFRGKRVDNGEWIDGDYCQQDAEYVALIGVWSKLTRSCDWIPVTSESVGQNTGLKDKNEQEIYEFMEVNNKYRVIFKFNRYILQCISNSDIFVEIAENEEYEITREYSPV